MINFAYSLRIASAKKLRTWSLNRRGETAAEVSRFPSCMFFVIACDKYTHKADFCSKAKVAVRSLIAHSLRLTLDNHLNGKRFIVSSIRLASHLSSGEFRFVNDFAAVRGLICLLAAHYRAPRGAGERSGVTSRCFFLTIFLHDLVFFYFIKLRKSLFFESTWSKSWPFVASGSWRTINIFTLF